MKATELQIGDLVLCYNPSQTSDNYGTIIGICPAEGSITAHTFTVQFQDESILVDARKSWVKPIPLTAEILEKNEFLPSFEMGHDTMCVVNSEFSVYYRPDDTYLYAFKRDNDHGEGDFIISDYRSTRMKYVHELQHALRLCGLNDLADNFKI